LAPRRQAFLPALYAAFGRLGILAREIGAHPNRCLQRDRPGGHITVIGPGIAPRALRGFQEIAHYAVVLLRLAVTVGGQLDFLPVRAHPAVQLVEELGLQYPLVLLSAAAEPVDAVAQRAVALAVKAVHDARREAPVGVGPRHALVEVDQMALVDAGRRRVDDYEHLGREVLAAAVEDHARHVDAL